MKPLPISDFHKVLMKSVSATINVFPNQDENQYIRNLVSMISELLKSDEYIDVDYIEEKWAILRSFILEAQ